MGSYMYLYEKAREAHYQDLQREMAESRLRAHLPRHHLSRRVAGNLGVLLIKLGARLKQFEQSHITLEEHI